MSRKAIAMGKYDAIAGVATAGIAFGALVAADQNKPMVYVRSKAKAHGRQNLIEGHLEGNEKVFSYGFEKAYKAFAEAECPMETLSNYGELLNEAVKSEYITEAQQKDLEKWSDNPELWVAQ